MKKIIIAFLVFATRNALAQENSKVNFVKENYNKVDTNIVMRDGIKLYTVMYTPKDETQAWPILMERTPYSAAPYGNNNYPNRIGPGELMKEKYKII